MSKAISSFKGAEKIKVIKRRLASKTGGLGYLSAVAAEKKGALKAPVAATETVTPASAE